MRALDSATAPTLAQAQQARAQGYDAWLGYLTPSPGWHSATWPAAGFTAVQQADLGRAGIIFGPDSSSAIVQCHWFGLDLCFLDIEANDPGAYAQGWLDAVAAAGIRAGVYGLRRTIAALRADVHWFAVEHWDGSSMSMGQYDYDVTVAGVTVDVSDGNPAIFPEAPVSGAFKPGTHELHWCEVRSDGTIEHYWQDLATAGAPLQSENLGGQAVGQPWLAWSGDGQLAVVTVLGLGAEVYRNTYTQGGAFGGFTPTGATGIAPPGNTGPAGPQGPPGPTPASGKITDGTVTFG